MRVRLLSTDAMQMLCVWCITLWAISPPLAYDETARVVVLLAALLWSAIEIIKRPSTFIRPSLPTGCALLFVGYSAVLALRFEGSEDIVLNIQTYIFLQFLIFHESYRKRDIRQLRLVFWTYLLVVPVWLVATLRAYGEMPDISRIMSRSSEIAVVQAGEGVGGYGLVYSVVLAIPILVSLIKAWPFRVVKGRGILKRAFAMTLLAINLVLSVVVVLKAGYSIALILMICSVSITLIISRKAFLTPIRAFVILLMLLVAISFATGSLSERVMAVSEQTPYARKTEDVLRSLEGYAGVGGVADRNARYASSIALFLENPVLGTLEVGGTGGHSAVLDRFASYGIFIGIIFAYTVLYLPLRYLRRDSNRSYGVVLSVVIIVGVVSFFNTLFATFGFMLFVFYPVAMTYSGDFDGRGQPGLG